jgi:hypothetical protein
MKLAMLFPVSVEPTLEAIVKDQRALHIINALKTI